VVLVVFNVINSRLFSIGIFPWFMLAAMMAYQPDMMIQFSRFLKEMYREREKADVEIFWRSEVSLNGRPFRAFIDPGVDLARQKRIWGHQPWILPAPEL
jgi:hypothetical protein